MYPRLLCPSNWIYSIDMLQTMSDVPRPLQLLGLTAGVELEAIIASFNGGGRSRKGSNCCGHGCARVGRR